MALRQALVAEFIGTFFLVFAGAGAIVVDAMTHAITHVGVALVFGLVVAALVYALAHVSGAHFNPAVTIGFWASGGFPGSRVPAYIAAQLAGAIAAAAVLRGLFGTVASVGAMVPNGAVSISFWLELLMTFLLVFVIFGSAVRSRARRAVSSSGWSKGQTFSSEPTCSSNVSITISPVHGAAAQGTSLAMACNNGVIQ